MKHLILSTSVVFICLCSYFTQAQSDAAEKAWVAYKTPGDVHKMLATDAGEWKTETTSWMSPGTEPVKSSGVCINKMIMDGRYLESSYKGDMMGMPFEGKGITGYDNAKKIIVSTWIDNFGTGVTYMEGNWDAATKSTISKGKFVDPESGKDMEMKEVYKIIDDKSRIMEMYMTMPDGKEFKTMEIKYTRK